MTLPCRLPVVQAPMAGGPSTPALAAAVNSAGGFGYVAAGYLSPAALRATIERTQELTSAPFGVNVFVPTPPVVDDAAIAAYATALESVAGHLGVRPGEPTWDDDAYLAKLELLTGTDVHTVSFTFGCPAGDVIAELHHSGTQVAVTVTSAVEARQAARVGADLLIVQGTEAGGHQGTFDAGGPNQLHLLDALAEVRAVIDLPMVATGGIMTRAAAEDALAAGAAAVQIGTALLCSPEAGTSDVHRRALREQHYTDTELTRAFSGRWARGLANRFLVEHRDAPAGYPQLHHLTRPLRAAATKAGNPDVPNLWAGTGWRETSAAPAAEIVRAIAP